MLQACPGGLQAMPLRWRSLQARHQGLQLRVLKLRRLNQGNLRLTASKVGAAGKLQALAASSAAIHVWSAARLIAAARAPSGC